MDIFAIIAIALAYIAVLLVFCLGWKNWGDKMARMDADEELALAKWEETHKGVFAYEQERKAA